VVNVKELDWLSSTTSVPESPETATLMVYVGTQVAVTVMFDVMVPLALLLRVQLCFEG
jgi:hypothetical protein